MTTRKTYLAGGVALLLMVMLFPSAAGAASRSSGDRPKQTRDSIFIDEMKDFNPSNGVRSGTGTARNPFVISNWDVSRIEIKDTDAHVVVRDNLVDDLTLDWIGGGIEVRNNEVGDLRVNQNRKRTGDPTSGVIENNTFGVVGQLRHFDGAFQNNDVGSEDQMRLPFFDGRAVNFDGFNGSVFRNNTIYGYMDARLHGHHHSSGFDETSHYHGAAPESHDHETMDHTVRYHQVHIYGNTIYSDYYYALAYLDTAHSANDRTAASETEESLNDPHVHYTKVFMHDNKLVGSGLYVDVFNAKDRLHKATGRGLVEIFGNEIVLQPSNDLTTTFSSRNGIDVGQAVDVTMRIFDNTIAAPETEDPAAAVTQSWDSVSGINMWNVDKADIYLSGNTISHTPFGIRASRFSKTVNWTIAELVTSDVDQPVYWDSSVENPPKRRG
jgi:hypothetical protein